MTPLPQALVDQLAESVRRPLPSFTSRHLFGRISLPGKATAATGVRRAGKTTFLHQLRPGAPRSGTPQERLPYLSFEDERLAGSKPTTSACWWMSTTGGFRKHTRRRRLGASTRSSSFRGGNGSCGGSSTRGGATCSSPDRQRRCCPVTSPPPCADARGRCWSIPSLSPKRFATRDDRSPLIRA